MIFSEFPVTGCWDKESVKSAFQPVESLPGSLIEASSRLFKEFSAGRPASYDGCLFGLRSLSVEGSVLTVIGSPVRFSWYLATRSISHPEAWPRANPLGTTSILVTRDNDILISIRSLKAEQNPGGLYFVGGFAEIEHSNEFNLFQNAEREIAEETGLDITTAINSISLLALAYDSAFAHPEAFFLVRLKLSSRELRAHLDNHKHEEAEKFELLSKDNFFDLPCSERFLTWSFLKGRDFIARYIQGGGTAKTYDNT